MTELRGQLDCDRMQAVDSVHFRGDIFRLRTVKPVPPGTRVIVSERGECTPLVQGKVVSVAAETPKPGLWEVDVKLFAPSKKARQRLLELAQETASE